MKIIINNYFSGVLKRGIPIYTAELSAQLRRDGNDVVELKCPPKLRRLPAFIHNIFFVVFEQIFTPIYGIVYRSHLNIYPYNSASLIDVLTGKSLIIIHDLISLKKKNKGLASRYVSACIAFSSRFSSKYAYISKSTQRILQRVELYSHSTGYYLPNTFYQFENCAKNCSIKDLGYVLLVTGHGENKDLSGALRLYFSLGDELKKPLKILGCGNHAEYVRSLIAEFSLTTEIDIVGFVSLEKVVELYAHSSFIWAHSKAEGYGRAIAEGKILNKNILCSKITPFIEQKAQNVFYYTGVEDYSSAFGACLNHIPSLNDVEIPEHMIMRKELSKLYEKE